MAAIIDVYSRMIVGWGLANTLDAQVSLEVIKQAVATYGCPEIINSDQGSRRGPASSPAKNTSDT